MSQSFYDNNLSSLTEYMEPPRVDSSDKTLGSLLLPFPSYSEVLLKSELGGTSVAAIRESISYCKEKLPEVIGSVTQRVYDSEQDIYANKCTISTNTRNITQLAENDKERKASLVKLEDGAEAQRELNVKLSSGITEAKDECKKSAEALHKKLESESGKLQELINNYKIELDESKQQIEAQNSAIKSMQEQLQAFEAKALKTITDRQNEESQADNCALVEAVGRCFGEGIVKDDEAMLAEQKWKTPLLSVTEFDEFFNIMTDKGMLSDNEKYQNRFNQDIQDRIKIIVDSLKARRDEYNKTEHIISKLTDILYRRFLRNSEFNYDFIQRELPELYYKMYDYAKQNNDKGLLNGLIGGLFKGMEALGFRLINPKSDELCQSDYHMTVATEITGSQAKRGRISVCSRPGLILDRKKSDGTIDSIMLQPAQVTIFV